MKMKITPLLSCGCMLFLTISCAGNSGGAAPTADQTEMAAFLSAIAPADGSSPAASTKSAAPEFTSTPTVSMTPTPTFTLTPTSTPPPETVSTRLAAGGTHTCAITLQGGVQCWGDNKYGQLGNGAKKGSSVPVDVIGLESGVLAVAASLDNTCALREDGGVTCWGVNGYPPADVGGFRSRVTAIAVGTAHACALLDSGAVQCWGENNQGQLGNGTQKASDAPVDVQGLDGGVLAVSAGGFFSCALLSGGGVKCWGMNSDGELGDGTTKRSTVPVDVSGLASSAAAIKAGESHACAILGGGRLQCWGNNFYGQLGNKSDVDSSRPVDVNGLLKGVLAAAAGKGHTCALLNTGWMQCWGENGRGQLGFGETGSNAAFYEPVDVRWQLNGITGMAAGGSHTCVRLNNGGLKCWGGNDRGQLGDGTTESSVAPVDVVGLDEALATHTPVPQFKAVALSGTCALTSAGGVRCWGRNSGGQLGNGTNVDSSIPVDVEGLTSGVTAIASGDGTTCAITTAGGMKCWGGNLEGQLGDGSVTNRNRPVDVIGLDKDVTAIAVGPRNACAAMRTGGVKCWGANQNGQLGIGGEDMSTHTIPVDVAGFTDTVKALALDWGVACALTTAGSVKCWGGSAVGELGNGEGPLRNGPDDHLPEITNSYAPANVAGLPGNIQDISLDGGVAFALTEDGRVMGWGNNCCGELGDGTLTDRNIPVAAILPPGKVTAISAKYPNALIDNKYLISWGKLGIFLAMDFSDLPGGIVDFSGQCVLTGAGGVKCWGDGFYGSLGNGTFAISESPVDVIGFPGGAPPG